VPENTSISARDRGLALISRLNRWMIAGAVGLTGVVSILAKESFHGRTLSSAGSTVSQSSASGSSSSPSSSSGSSGSIQQPSQSPAPAPAPVVSAPVVSGGS
jgi:hypothetical protein